MSAELPARKQQALADTAKATMDTDLTKFDGWMNRVGQGVNTITTAMNPLQWLRPRGAPQKFSAPPQIGAPRK